MKILLLFPMRDKQTGPAIKLAFEKLGHKVISVDAKRTPQLSFSVAEVFRPDLVFCSRTVKLVGEIEKIKKRFKDKNNTIVEIPTLNNVPVRMSSCNNRKTFVYFPVKLGDLGIVHFCTRSIDNYLATPDQDCIDVKPVYHDNSRHHDFSDAWFELGGLPFDMALQNVSSDDIIIKNDNITINIDPTGKIAINNGTNELMETLSTLIQNLIDAKVITMMGGQGFIASTITALTSDKSKIDSLKV